MHGRASTRNTKPTNIQLELNPKTINPTPKPKPLDQVSVAFSATPIAIPIVPVAPTLGGGQLGSKVSENLTYKA